MSKSVETVQIMMRISEAKRHAKTTAHALFSFCKYFIPISASRCLAIVQLLSRIYSRACLNPTNARRILIVYDTFLRIKIDVDDLSPFRFPISIVKSLRIRGNEMKREFLIKFKKDVSKLLFLKQQRE